MAFNIDEIERSARLKRQRLKEIEREYHRASEFLKAFPRDPEELLRELESMAMGYVAGDPPEKAVYLIAQQRQLLADYKWPFRVIEEHERLTQEMKNLAEEDFRISGKEPTAD